MTDKPEKYVVVEDLIHAIRGQKVILDRDLAALYGVPTFRFNEAVKRNRNRFPVDFSFQLTPGEFTNLISQNAISSQGHGGVRKLPWVFTEHGAIMAATILNSPKAVRLSVFVVRAFVKMRERLVMTHLLEKHLAAIDRKLLSHDASLRDIYERIRPLLMPPPGPPKRKIGFRLEESRVKYRVGKFEGKKGQKE